MKLAVQSAGMAGVHRMIKFTVSSAASYRTHASTRPQLVVVNPPWDRRLHEGAEQSWMELRDFADALQRQKPVAVAKAAATTATATNDGSSSTAMWVLSGNQQLPPLLRRRAAKTISVRGASVQMQFLKYEF